MWRRLTGSLIVVVMVFSFLSCEDLFTNDYSDKKNISQFIKLDSLLKSNVAKLNDRKLIKVVSLDGEQETMNFIADSILLAEDFALFEDINISRPSFFGEYDISHNEHVDTFIRKGKKGPEELILNKSISGKPTLIEAEYSESNLLYNSLRKYSLKFDELSNEIVAYKFSGYQKLIFKDTVFFGIKGKFQ